ncbi:MAG TPA: FtsX-like permease family protein, partial [Planctomycetota bacterium]|nr:FtsX-like permease family protein [Planctomycetota bacterium]
MYRFFLSQRYIRMRPINWIGTLSIFVAVSALILILAIMSGFLEKSREHLRGHLSDLVIAPSFDIPLNSNGQTPPRAAGPILEAVRAHPSVQAAAAQMVWFGMLVPPRGETVLSDPSGMGMVMVSFVGVDIPDEYGATSLRKDLEIKVENGLPGQRPENLDDPFAYPKDYERDPDERPLDCILMGERLAANWGLRKGDQVELATATLDPDTGSFRQAANRTVVLAGTYRSTFNEMDLSRIYMKREALADWLGRHGQYSQLVVKLRDYERDWVQTKADLRQELGQRGLIHPSPKTYTPGDFGWEIQTWEDSRHSMLAAIENERALLGIMLGLVLLVAGFGVFAILSMMVSEKRRDIGILSALGATPKGILTLFLSIGGLEALVGAFLGVVMGVYAAHNINDFELWLSSTFGIQIFDRKVYYFDHIPTVIEWGGIVLIAVAAVGTALVAAAIPALRAAYLNPVDA